MKIIQVNSRFPRETAIKFAKICKAHGYTIGAAMLALGEMLVNGEITFAKETVYKMSVLGGGHAG